MKESLSSISSAEEYRRVVAAAAAAMPAPSELRASARSDEEWIHDAREEIWNATPDVQTRADAATILRYSRCDFGYLEDPEEEMEADQLDWEDLIGAIAGKMVEYDMMRAYEELHSLPFGATGRFPPGERRRVPPPRF